MAATVIGSVGHCAVVERPAFDTVQAGEADRNQISATRATPAALRSALKFTTMFESPHPLQNFT